jgi:hypothetical protein
MAPRVLTRDGHIWALAKRPGMDKRYRDFFSKNSVAIIDKLIRKCTTCLTSDEKMATHVEQGSQI